MHQPEGEVFLFFFCLSFLDFGFLPRVISSFNISVSVTDKSSFCIEKSMLIFEKDLLAIGNKSK